MKILNIAIANKVATYCQRDGFIVCGNKDYKITFTFDSEWDAHTVKTVRFKWNGNYQDIVMGGDTIDVPRITNATEVEVGVFAGDLCTTTPAKIPCVKSILCGEGTPEAPAPDVYSQIIEMINTGTIAINEDDYWVIYGAVSNVKARGENGKTPTIDISEDNYWIINGVKTGHKSIGEVDLSEIEKIIDELETKKLWLYELSIRCGTFTAGSNYPDSNKLNAHLVVTVISKRDLENATFPLPYSTLAELLGGGVRFKGTIDKATSLDIGYSFIEAVYYNDSTSKVGVRYYTGFTSSDVETESFAEDQVKCVSINKSTRLI